MCKETSNSESLACVEECLRKKFEEDVDYYKEQICRLEATLAAHQERLGRLLKASRRAAAKPTQQTGVIPVSYLYYKSIALMGRDDNLPSLALDCGMHADHRPRMYTSAAHSCFVTLAVVKEAEQLVTCKLGVGGRKHTHSGKYLTRSGHFAQNKTIFNIFYFQYFLTTKPTKSILHYFKMR